MHLEGPWLSTTGKHKTKRKWASSEAKKLAQARQAEWDRKLAEFDRMAPKFSTGPYNSPRKTMSDFMPKTPPGRETVRAPSQDPAGSLVPQSKIPLTQVARSKASAPCTSQTVCLFLPTTKPKILAVCAVDG